MKSRNLALAGLMMSLLAPLLPTCVFAGAQLQLTSPAISDGATIPTQFTCSGANQSPPLAWTGIPSSAKSLALLMEDPDAPAGTFVHWVVYDIPPTSTGFQEGVAEGKPGANGMGKNAYMGPCPPPGSPHHYHFRLFALDTNLAPTAAPNASALRAAINGHIIQSAELVGIFGR